MHFTAIVFFLYLLCTACASPLYLKARHNGDKLISRALRSRSNTACKIPHGGHKLTPRTPSSGSHMTDDEIAQIVLRAWNEDKGQRIVQGQKRSLYLLKDPFQKEGLKRLFEHYGLEKPDEKHKYFYIDRTEAHDEIDFKDLGVDIQCLKDANEFFGSVTQGNIHERSVTHMIWSSPILVTNQPAHQ